MQPWVRYAYVAALVATQIANVCGSIYLKATLSSASQPVHPVTFAFYRELAAGAILISLSAVVFPKHRPSWSDAVPIAGLGCALFLNQLLYILGLRFAGVAAATSFQPAIPVFTALLAMLAGQEKASGQRVTGVVLASAGAVAMVAGAAQSRGRHGDGIGDGAASAASSGFAHVERLVGAICLVGNCLAMAAYFLIARSLTSRYPSLCLTAWAYVAAAAWMAGVISIAVPRSATALPPAALGPLAYWVLVTSVLGYSALTAATRHLPATHVASTICLQPVFGTALAVLTLGERLRPLDAGALGILLGLALVLHESAATGGAAARLAGSSSFLSSVYTPRGGEGAGSCNGSLVDLALLGGADSSVRSVSGVSCGRAPAGGAGAALSFTFGHASNGGDAKEPAAVQRGVATRAAWEASGEREGPCRVPSGLWGEAG